MTLYVAPIVEGQTEVACLPGLLNRIWVSVLAAPSGIVPLPPVRCDRSSVVLATHDDLQKKIREADRRLRPCLLHDQSGRGLILLVLDADDDCPKDLAQRLKIRAEPLCRETPFACVLAKRQLENWFKAGASTLGGQCGLPATLIAPANPEDGSGSTWLGDLMRKTSNRPYKKTADAPVLARHMSLTECLAHSRSFRKLCDELRKRLPPTPEPPCTASA